jgi:hypothetical protein
MLKESNIRIGGLDKWGDASQAGFLQIPDALLIR